VLCTTLKQRGKKREKLFYSASFKHTERRDVKVGAAKAFPPKVLSGAVAADEFFFFHVIPQHGTINLSPQKQFIPIRQK
jgi:hypothetical protein